MSNPLPVPRALLDFIKTGDKFLVAGHKEPDGDCVGSQLALCSALGRLGKKAIPCSLGPFKRTEVLPYANRFVSAPTDQDRAGAQVILVDCSSPSRSGDLASALEGLPTAIIDHHAAGEYAAAEKNGTKLNTGPVFIDPKAPSTTSLVLRLIEALGLEPVGEEGELLFFGLCTDTGFFRHVDSRGEHTFAAAARMIRAGANPKSVFNAMHGGKSLNSRYLLGILLSRAQPYFGGKLILTTEEYEDTQRFGLEGRDSDSLYQLLQSVEGVEAIVVIRQETPENCTVGFRSRDRVDVAVLAEHFGGGGHRNAAGANITGTIARIQPQILQTFEKIFSVS